LPSELPIENICEPHISWPRNGLIAEVFNRAGMIELLGTGIQRICKKTKEYYLPDPDFKIFSGCLVVIIKDS
jgi:ATP-dependent DNA helicase RecG